MSPELKARLVAAFPYVLAAALPLAGLLLGLARFAERRTTDGLWLIAAALLGTIIWLSVLAL